jgi:hypothetical protein
VYPKAWTSDGQPEVFTAPWVFATGIAVAILARMDFSAMLASYTDMRARSAQAQVLGGGWCSKPVQHSSLNVMGCPGSACLGAAAACWAGDPIGCALCDTSQRLFGGYESQEVVAVLEAERARLEAAQHALEAELAVYKPCVAMDAGAFV